MIADIFVFLFLISCFLPIPFFFLLPFSHFSFLLHQLHRFFRIIISWQCLGLYGSHIFFVVIFENSPSVLNIKKIPLLFLLPNNIKILQHFNFNTLTLIVFIQNYFILLPSILVILVPIWSDPHILDIIIYTI